MTGVGATRVVVCTGPGGVGKTTASAALAVAFADAGRRVALITVDPAKRLADVLGAEVLGANVIDAGAPHEAPSAGLTNDPRRVDLGRSRGSLHALMLDARATFDALVRRHAASAEQIDRILANRYYQNIAGALGGTQEYMAMEKLYELTQAPTGSDGLAIEPFDIVVVDTPPTKNALDLLRAPERLLRLLDNAVFRTMMMPARGLRVLGLGLATKAALGAIGKVVGSEVVADAVAFFQAFEGMEPGFRERARHVGALLHSASTQWVVVSAPRTETVVESVELVQQLRAGGAVVAAALANRMQPHFSPLPKADGSPAAIHGAVARAEAANTLADAHDRALDTLRALGLDVFPVALRPGDVRALPDLRRLATELGGLAAHLLG